MENTWEDSQEIFQQLLIQAANSVRDGFREWVARCANANLHVFPTYRKVRAALEQQISIDADFTSLIYAFNHLIPDVVIASPDPGNAAFEAVTPEIPKELPYQIRPFPPIPIGGWSMPNLFGPTNLPGWSIEIPFDQRWGWGPYPINTCAIAGISAKGPQIGGPNIWASLRRNSWLDERTVEGARAIMDNWGNTPIYPTTQPITPPRPKPVPR